MITNSEIQETGSFSLRSAALIAGFGLLIMAFSAPVANFYFMSQSVVTGDAAATVENLQTNGTPYSIGTMLLFTTYAVSVRR